MAEVESTLKAQEEGINTLLKEQAAIKVCNLCRFARLQD